LENSKRAQKGFPARQGKIDISKKHDLSGHIEAKIAMRPNIFRSSAPAPSCDSPSS